MGAPVSATILVVDDEASMVELFAAFLGEHYCVRTATSGEAALDQFTSDVDAVILDRRMPGMSGDEVLEHIRERSPHVPVAMLTAIDPDVDIIEMPFDDYLRKPVLKDELLSRVRILLERVTYDEQSQEFFALAAKKQALETAGNDESREYKRLTERMQGLRQELGDTLDGHLS